MNIESIINGLIIVVVTLISGVAVISLTRLMLMG